MAKIVVPVSFEATAIRGRLRSPIRMQLVEGVEYEVPEVTSADAPLVATLNVPWPVSGLPGQWGEAERDDAMFGVGTFGLRKFNGNFVVPVRQFSKHYAEQPRPISPEDLDQLNSSKNQFVAPLDGQKGRREWIGRLKAGEKQMRGTEDIGLSWDEIGVRNITWVGEDRARRIEKGNPAGLVFIDGELYDAVSEEPKIRCIFYQYEINVSVCLEARISTGTTEYFRLDRLDDCIEHVNSVAPEMPLFVGVKDLTIHDHEAFEYADEKENIMWLAWTTHLHLSKLGAHLNQEPDVLGIFFKMRNMKLSEWTAETTEAAADCLDALSYMAVEKFGIDPKKLADAVRRWQLRPVDRALAPRQ